jgi:hypothetical protein
VLNSPTTLLVMSLLMVVLCDAVAHSDCVGETKAYPNPIRTLKSRRHGFVRVLSVGEFRAEELPSFVH